MLHTLIGHSAVDSAANRKKKKSGLPSRHYGFIQNGVKDIAIPYQQRTWLQKKNCSFCDVAFRLSSGLKAKLFFSNEFRHHGSCVAVLSPNGPTNHSKERKWGM